MKKYIYPLIFAAILSMGAKKCVSLDAQQYINTNARDGLYDADPSQQSSFCSSDPYSLDNIAHLKNNLRLQVLGGSVPNPVYIEEYGQSSIPSTGFQYRTIYGSMPAYLTTTGNNFPSGTHFYGITWTASQFLYSPLECFANNWNCPYITIYPIDEVHVTVTSGWQNFNNGQTCWNSWPYLFVTCDKVGSRDAYWWECFLPLFDSAPAE